MRTLRVVMFFIMIALGVVLGLIYGWVVDPKVVENSTPQMLRSDYVADYTLMVSQIYQSDGNLAEATERLGLLDEGSPVMVTQQAIVTAQSLEYAPEDLRAMQQLYDALREASQPPGGQP